MKKLYLITILLLIILSAFGCTPKVSGKDPRNYVLREDELPVGFGFYEPSKEDLKEAGMTSNPGYITDEEYWGLFEYPNKVEKIYVGAYAIEELEKGYKDFSFIIMVMKFKSEKDFLEELDAFKKGISNEEFFDYVTILNDGEIGVMIFINEDLINLKNEVVKNLKAKIFLEEIPKPTFSTI